MLKGIDENGNLRNVKVSENGELLVQQSSGSSSSGGTTVVNNETTLKADVITAGTTSQDIQVNKKVTEISIANYSDSSDVTMTIGQTNYVVGSNIAVDIPINKTITSIAFSATANDTKIQYVVKGVE